MMRRVCFATVELHLAMQHLQSRASCIRGLAEPGLLCRRDMLCKGRKACGIWECAWASTGTLGVALVDALCQADAAPESTPQCKLCSSFFCWLLRLCLRLPTAVVHAFFALINYAAAVNRRAMRHMCGRSVPAPMIPTPPQPRCQTDTFVWRCRT